MRDRNSVFLALICCFGMLYPTFAKGQGSGSLSLMPTPLHISQGQGRLKVDSGFTVGLEGYKDERLELARKRFLTALSRQTGIPYHLELSEGTPTLVVKTSAASKQIQSVGEDESYHLEVTPTNAIISAPNPLGAMHGLETFLQLVTITPDGFAAPAVTVDDAPRFAWRGLMIDSGRHFQPMDVIKRNIDGMEAVKLNVFHWHLSEDQGFRAESKVYPLLTGKGSNGDFYTQSEMKEVVDYARDRGIRVVPEFDMPCHTTSWFVGYPDLASGKGPYQIQTRWGVFNPAMDPSRDSTFAFIDKFIGEMTTIFPDEYFHVGGDECNGKEWDANPKLKSFMQQHQLKDNAALQSYFSGRVQKIVAAHHRIMVGWDEVLQPNTPKDVVIQSWRGPEGPGGFSAAGESDDSVQWILHRSEPVCGRALSDRPAGRGCCDSVG